jgi:hypothetical protein
MWIAIGTAILTREPGVLVQLRELARSSRAAATSSSWIVLQSLQEWLIQEEAELKEKETKATTASPAAAASTFAVTIATPIEGSGTRRASSIALAGLTASPSNVNQSIKRRLSVAQMSSLSSSSGVGSGSKQEETQEMQRFWRSCDALLMAFGEEALLDSFL